MAASKKSRDDLNAAVRLAMAKKQAREADGDDYVRDECPMCGAPRASADVRCRECGWKHHNTHKTSGEARFSDSYDRVSSRKWYGRRLAEGFGHGER